MHLAYSASQNGQAVSTAVDLFHITIADDKPITILGIDLYQTTDLGDAQEEVLALGIYSGVTGGGGGTALTEVALHEQNSITAGTAVVGQGTASTSGTLRALFGWNIRQAGSIYLPIPEARVTISQAGSAAAVRFLAAPADAVTMSAEIRWAEIIGL